MASHGTHASRPGVAIRSHQPAVVIFRSTAGYELALQSAQAVDAPWDSRPASSRSPPFRPSPLVSYHPPSSSGTRGTRPRRSCYASFNTAEHSTTQCEQASVTSPLGPTPRNGQDPSSASDGRSSLSFFPERTCSLNAAEPWLSKSSPTATGSCSDQTTASPSSSSEYAHVPASFPADACRRVRLWPPPTSPPPASESVSCRATSSHTSSTIPS